MSIYKVIFYFFLTGFCLFFPCLSWVQDSFGDIPQHNQDTQRILSLSLDDATRLALRNNFDIQLAQYDYAIADTYSLEARSIYDTFLSAQAQYQRDRSQKALHLDSSHRTLHRHELGLQKRFPSGTTIRVDQHHQRLRADSSAVAINPSHDSALGLTVAQDLGKNFFGIQNRGSIAIADLDSQNFRYFSLDKIEQSLVNVQIAYWDVVLRKEILRTAKDVLSQARELFEVNQEKIKNRLIEQPEFLASQANYRQKKMDVSIADNDFETAKNILKLYLNAPEDILDLSPSQEMILFDIKENLEESLARAFSYRRDYQAAVNTAKRQGVYLSMKKNNLWPEINLRASFLRNGLGEHFRESVENITREDHSDFSAGIRISFPLENRSARAQLTRAEYEKAQALLNIKFIERRIMISIVDQVRTCNILYAQAKNQKEIADIEKKKYQELKKIFTHGRSDMDTLIRYQQEAALAQQQAALAAYHYKVSLIQLRALEGALLTQYWPDSL